MAVLIIESLHREDRLLCFLAAEEAALTYPDGSSIHAARSNVGWTALCGRSSGGAVTALHRYSQRLGCGHVPRSRQQG